MKKFLCMTMLMLAALTVSDMAQTRAASPPEQDIATPAAEVGMTLVAYRWPTNKNENANLRNDYTSNYAPDGDAYSFTSSRADFS